MRVGKQTKNRADGYGVAARERSPSWPLWLVATDLAARLMPRDMCESRANPPKMTKRAWRARNGQKRPRGGAIHPSGWSDSPPVGGSIHSTHHARWWRCRGASRPRSRPGFSCRRRPALKPLFSRAVRTVAWNAVRGFGREASKPRERPTGTRSAQTPEKRRRSGRGAFRETRSGRSGRSSRGLTSRSSAERPVRRCH